MDKFKNIQNVYYLGPRGSYSSLAVKFFSNFYNLKNLKFNAQKNIKTLLKNFEYDKSSIAVVPIENSIQGIVKETINNIMELNDDKTTFYAEYVLNINHALISKANDKNTVKTILSHPQALQQCENYIFNNFKNAKIQSKNSTSEAIYELKDLDETSAAIGNPELAFELGLNVLEREINDEKDNQTRFILLTRFENENTIDAKTNIVFSTQNKPGALCDILNILKKYDINLTYIDSRPSKKNLGEYLFLADLKGHKSDENIKQALFEINKNTQFCKINGSYTVLSH